ncbi:MAG: hypothetical protein PHU07_11305 [Acidocella sp.]|nr:hypothetical protein [Acidocella sp.]
MRADAGLPEDHWAGAAESHETGGDEQHRRCEQQKQQAPEDIENTLRMVAGGYQIVSDDGDELAAPGPGFEHRRQILCDVEGHPNTCRITAMRSDEQNSEDAEQGPKAEIPLKIFAALAEQAAEQRRNENGQDVRRASLERGR